MVKLLHPCVKEKMFRRPKDNFFPKKARLNFEVYGQNNPITPKAGEWGKRLLFHLGKSLKSHFNLFLRILAFESGRKII